MVYNIVHLAYAACEQVYPSEYAYPGDSVRRAESVTAYCRRYPSGLYQEEFTELYTRCDGILLKLTDSDLGQEQYNPNDYYVWPAGRDGQLLFILPTRVSLTAITLYYYSDSARGLPRLSFFAVPDDFDIWEQPTTGYQRANVASVPPGGEPAGQRSVSINVNFNTMRVLMYKSSSTFQFAVSEVEFFTCKQFLHVVMCTILHVVRQYTYAGVDTTAATTTSSVSSVQTEHSNNDKMATIVEDLTNGQNITHVGEIKTTTSSTTEFQHASSLPEDLETIKCKE